ncbi:MAG TPA: hypothetical protein VE399_05710 [Gemmatimonadales bacterium]|jgi:hypothetical protein|nr:hypothetical protein [Gemmatimonadales bacterium]
MRRSGVGGLLAALFAAMAGTAYAVSGTSETGELLLPGDTTQSGSVTSLITLRQGTLEVSLSDQWVTRTSNEAAACPPRNTNQLQARMGQ